MDNKEELVHQTLAGDEQKAPRGDGLPYDEAEKVAKEAGMDGPSNPTEIDDLGVARPANEKTRDEKDDEEMDI